MIPLSLLDFLRINFGWTGLHDWDEDELRF